MTGRILRLTIRVLALLLAAVSLGGLATACSYRVGGSQDVATELRADGIYIDGDGAAEVDEQFLSPAVDASDPPIYVVVEGSAGTSGPAERLRYIRDDTAMRATYVGYYLDKAPSERLIAYSNHLTPSEIAALRLDTSSIEDPNVRLERFIAGIDRLNGGTAVAPTPHEVTLWDRVWPFVMWTLIVVGCLLVGGFVMRLWERGKLERLGWALIRPRPLPSPFGVLPRTSPVELPPREPRPMDVTEVSTESWEDTYRADDVRESTDERITLFGEALAELPVDLSEATLDPRVRAHAEAALVCYEQAKRGLEMDGSLRLRNATAGKWLDDGFHHLAAINALRAGEPPPEPPPDLRWVEP